MSLSPFQPYQKSRPNHFIHKARPPYLPASPCQSSVILPLWKREEDRNLGGEVEWDREKRKIQEAQIFLSFPLLGYAALTCFHPSGKLHLFPLRGPSSPTIWGLVMQSLVWNDRSHYMWASIVWYMLVESQRGCAVCVVGDRFELVSFCEHVHFGIVSVTSPWFLSVSRPLLKLQTGTSCAVLWFCKRVSCNSEVSHATMRPGPALLKTNCRISLLC